MGQSGASQTAAAQQQQQQQAEAYAQQQQQQAYANLANYFKANPTSSLLGTGAGPNGGFTPPPQFGGTPGATQPRPQGGLQQALTAPQQAPQQNPQAAQALMQMAPLFARRTQ